MRLLLCLLQPIAKITVAGALHYRLRTGELHAEPLRHRKVRAADQQEAQLWFTQLLVEHSIATASHVRLEGVRRLPDHVIVKSVTGCVPLETCRHPRPGRLAPPSATFHHISDTGRRGPDG